MDDVLDAAMPYLAGRPNAEYFARPEGQEHYRLLARMAQRLPSGAVAVDIGTYLGFSALALATNPDVRVVSFDIVARDVSPMPPNVKLLVGDVTSEYYADLLRDAALVVLDVDPHDGVQEAAIYRHLQSVGFGGVLVCDDINLNAGMRRFWQVFEALLTSGRPLGANSVRLTEADRRPKGSSALQLYFMDK